MGSRRDDPPQGVAEHPRDPTDGDGEGLAWLGGMDWAWLMGGLCVVGVGIALPLGRLMRG